MKDALICLRISNDLRSSLRRISELDRRSLSSTVENILYTYTEQRRLQDLAEEKRRYPRKTISAPALVRGPDGTVHAGMVHDISLGGICVAAPRDFPCEAGEDFRISVVFTLPKSETPLAVQCIPRHVRPGKQVHVGASFIDDGCQTFDAIRRHFVN
jgi:hypothetical protein